MLRIWAIVLATTLPGFVEDKPLHGVALVIGQSDYTDTLPPLANGLLSGPERRAGYYGDKLARIVKLLKAVS